MCICLQYNIQTVCVCTYVYAAAAAKSLQSCPTVLPHRRQPTRLLCPWDSPGKNTGVDFHFLLQCMKVKWKWSHWVVSDSLRPHGLSPTRLLRPWDFPGKSTRVGGHLSESDLSCIMRDLLLQHMESLVATCRLSCSVACGILVPQLVSKPVSWHCKADS